VKLRGVHHLTAIAGDPQSNLDFYTQVLGLRFVKRTVNFDDPSTYHLYFGDRTGRPGSAITFFTWPGARRGQRGAGQVVAISFAIPHGAGQYWQTRFKELRVFSEVIPDRFNNRAIRFLDHDSLMLELIESGQLIDVDLDFASHVPAEFAVRGFNAPTLEVSRLEPTEQLLGQLGFELIGSEESRRRFSLNQDLASAQLDLVTPGKQHFGVNAAGTVHHIAFRCHDLDEQRRWREKLVGLGLYVTPVIDRQYFHSIYFREPGGVLFEIATEGPGFTVDEPVDNLGNSLKLPPQYEPHRREIEGALPPISVKPTPAVVR
jgi:glyoxalase family protein